MANNGCFSIVVISLLLTTATAAVGEDGNYFDRISLYSNGRIVRFEEIPISVFIDESTLPQGDPHSYLAAFRYAMAEWSRTSDGLIAFREVESKDLAKISVEWVAKSLSARADNALGEAILVETDDGETVITTVDIQLSTVMPNMVEQLTGDRMKAVSLHEIGHAIGLWGHSTLEEDVMYPSSENLTPSPRDLATLRKVYNTPNMTSHHEAALKLVNDAIAAGIDTAKNRYLLGSIYFDLGDYDKAIDQFLVCLEKDQRYMAAGQKLVRAYLNKGNTSQAMQRYEAMLEQNPSPELYNQVGALNFESGNIDAAIDYFRKSLQMRRGFPPAQKNLMNAYKAKADRQIETGKYDEAVMLLKEVIRFQSSDVQAHLMLGVAYSRMNNHLEAAGEFEAVLRLNPGYLEAKENLAATYNNLGVDAGKAKNWQQAISYYEKALKLDPDMPELKSNLEAAYWNLGQHLAALQNRREAINAFRKCLEIKPDLKEAHVQIGALYAELKEYPRSIAAFEKALAIDPEMPMARQNLIASYHAYAQQLDRSNRRAEAVEYLKKAIAMTEDDYDLKLNLGIIYDKWGKADEALAVYKELMEKNPNDENLLMAITNVHIRRGNSYLQARSYDRALAEFKAIPESHKNYSILDTIGYIYLMKGRYEDACAAFIKSLSLHPKGDVAFTNLKSIESRIEADILRKKTPEKEEKLARARLAIVRALILKGEYTQAKDKLKRAVRPGDKEELKSEALQLVFDLVKIFDRKGWKQNKASVVSFGLEIAPDNAELKALVK